MRIFQNVKFETHPTLIASWPGMGNVGLIATNYLRNKMEAQPLAEIDMNPYFIPEAVLVHEGVADFPRMPTSRIYFCQNPDVLIFESDVQIVGKEGFAITKSLMRFAADVGVSRVFTTAALPQNISHKTESQIYGAFTSKELLIEFINLNVHPMNEGYIAGLNGVLLGVAKSHSIDAGCFLGTIPLFATNLSYPKTSLKIIELIEDILNIEVDKTEINESIAIADNQFTAIEERIREFSGVILGNVEQLAANAVESLWGPHADEATSETVPQTIMEKIERLFQDAQSDKSKARALKRELDRWNVYELYEDRFLKIFKQK
ncbi:MAG: PAC2 family protein [Chitinivibrionia bacterium]|nr:PAC2 family protein [Chitinivibrionia bacterium]